MSAIFKAGSYRLNPPGLPLISGMAWPCGAEMSCVAKLGYNDTGTSSSATLSLRDTSFISLTLPLSIFLWSRLFTCPVKIRSDPKGYTCFAVLSLHLLSFSLSERKREDRINLLQCGRSCRHQGELHLFGLYQACAQQLCLGDVGFHSYHRSSQSVLCLKASSYGVYLKRVVLACVQNTFSALHLNMCKWCTCKFLCLIFTSCNKCCWCFWLFVTLLCRCNVHLIPNV